MAKREPADLAKVVVSLGDPLDPRDVDVDDVIRVRDHVERHQRARIVLRAWSQQQKDERELRKTYAMVLFAGLGAEVAVTFAAFFLVGLKVLIIEHWMAQSFLIVALLQTAGLVGVVVRYLFPSKSPVEVAQLLALTDEPRPARRPAKKS